MKKKLMLILLVSVLSFSLFAAYDLAIGPALGMMRTHYIIPIEENGGIIYQELIDYNGVELGGYFNTDNAAFALCQVLIRGSNTQDANVVTISLTYDGYFRSDDNPSIVRPYEIYMLQRVGRSSSGSGGENTISYFNRNNCYFAPGGSDQHFPASRLVSNNKYDLGYAWADFVLQLPGTPSEDRRGVTVGTTYYPLIEGTYSSEVTITASMTNEYGEIESASVTIPLVAEHTISVPESYGSSTVAMNVAPTANAVNMNLDQMLQDGIPVNVGNVTFAIRSNDTQNPGPADDKDMPYRIFASASSDPFVENSDGFMFVHEDFLQGVSSYTDSNSVPFYIDIVGTGNTVDRSATYDGTAYCDINSGIINGEYIQPRCNVLQVLSSDWDHYHTYEGSIYVGVNSNPNHMLNSGRYYGDIYIHVVDIGVVGGH